MNKQEYNERLEAIRERLEAAAVEVGELSNAAPYGFGSRVSYVVDRIKQAVEDINACIEYPPFSWRIDENKQKQAVTVWEDFTGYGFRFSMGDRLAAERLEILDPRGELSTAEDLERLNTVQAEFVKYARANYPAEFGRP